MEALLGLSPFALNQEDMILEHKVVVWLSISLSIRVDKAEPLIAYWLLPIEATKVPPDRALVCEP